MIELGQEQLMIQRHFCLYGDYDKDGTFCTPFEMFTRYIYKQHYGRPYNVGLHHKQMFQKFQDVIDGKCKRLIINVPPRFGKTELIKMFMAYGLALNPASKFLHLAGGDDLALLNSSQTRDYVKSYAYQQMFPHVKVKTNSDSKKRWDVEGEGGVYATSAGGQVIGFGSGLVDEMIDETEDMDKYLHSIENNIFGGATLMDDLMKPEEARSDLARGRINTRIVDTILTRSNSRNTPVILIMQRLHPNDPAGFLIDLGGWDVLSLPVLNEDGTPLFPHFMNLAEIEQKRREIGDIMFQSQYMQNPQPAEGLMYSGFKTYDVIPTTNKSDPKNYTDTADLGGDYLCSISYIETEVGCYITDVVHSNKRMETTTKLVVDSLFAFRHSQKKQIKAMIESNGAGRMFAQNVERELRILGDNLTKIDWFHQNKNKEERILHAAHQVENMIYFPDGWQYKFPSFYLHLTNHRAKGQRDMDDAADALTGIIENMSKKQGRILSFDLN